jgi:hypothetical protein
MKGKLKELTREDILKIPPAPISQRFCDFPEKDREFAELLFRFIKLRDGAARELIGDDEGKPDFLRRALEVLHVTGLNIIDRSLTGVDEIKILRVAAKMKRQQKVELQEVLKKAIAELASTKQNGGKAKSQKAKKKPDYTHSEDYTSVVWFGRMYNFTKTQALCIKHLWAEWGKSEGLGLSEKTIGEKIGSSADNYKLKHTFRVKRNNKSCQHPAWGKMIVSCGKGMFSLKSSRKK